MSRKLYISNSFNVNTLDDAASYFVEWTDINGTTTNIPCDSSGVGKVVPDGSGDAAWITAHLYRRVGDGVAELFAVPKIIMRAYKINGQEITSGVGGYPSTKYNSSFFTIQKYDYTWGERAKYVVEFYDASNNILVTSAICRNLDGTNGTNGSSAPYYDVYQYAWNSSIDTHPDSGWSDTIPSQGSNAYLWIKTTRWNWNSATSQYVEGATSYGRMTGERGTSIQTKGPAIAVIYDVYSYMQDLPSSAPKGSYAFVRYDQNYKHLWQYLPTGWEANDYTFKTNDIVLKLGDSQPWKFTAGGQGTLDHITAATDGDAYSVKMDGHLWQWNLEALNWLDLGQFKGEKGDDGTTYYTHIAWATNVYSEQGNIYVVGFVTSKAYNDTTHKWMGVLVDTNPNHDSSHPEHYTWSLTKGVQGDRGKIGRFFYYGGEFNATDPITLFKVNDATTPYFKDTDSGNYFVFNPTANPSNEECTMAEMWAASQGDFHNAPWEMMTNDFKYIITEAIFGSFAHFGSFIINGDWMISQQAATGSSSQDFADFGKNVPSGGDPLVDNGTNFIPVFAVDGLTGRTYQQDAVIRGQVNATSGSIGGFNIDNEELRVGNNADWTNPQTNHPYTLLGKGRSRFLNDDDNSLVQVSVGLNSDTNDSRRALTVIRNDKYNNYPNSPAVEIRHISSYGSIGLRVQTGVSVFQDGIIPFSDFHYVYDNITLSGLYGNSIFFKGYNGTRQVTLPTYTEILNSLTYGMPSNVFALELTLATHIGSSTIEIKMPSGGYIMDYNGNIVNSITIAAGKYVKLMLVYDGSTYYAQKVYASYDM